MRLERKQDYLNPGKDACEGAGLLSLLFVKTPCRNVDLPGWQAAFHIPESPPHSPHNTPPELCHPQPPTSACPLPPSPAAGRDLGIPAVTQELPPLLSAFFSSRSESRTSLGPNPSGRGGRLYGSYCFHEIGIWSIFLTQESRYFMLKCNVI